ncbi:helix-turn-helix domain-containing protein [Desulfonatronovibrio magnus]|uniref:helix-turn-helix domain-containing protein n=1 Tax=Desulfonatronovibrio magnus TaxID=698827 RepID=UPI0005EBB172|nr:helix-turn-helix transcriptional regulator [Desulfonatronovibrio magnus]
MKPVKELKEKLLENPEVRAEYDRLGPEFKLASMLIEARSRAGLSQNDLARRMGMKQASVARIESGKFNPSMETLRKYAAATGHELKIEMLPRA